LDKLTSILAAIESPPTSEAVLDKAVVLSCHFNARIRVVELRDNETQSFILREAQEMRPDLVIKAPAAEHPLRRWTLGATDRLLAQECPAPLLLAGTRPWSAAPRLAACVDVSDVESAGFARAMLQAAGYLTVGCAGFLDVLYSERESSDERLRMERAVRLAQLVREYHLGSERLQIFNGAPAKILPPLIAARHYDVLVIGAVTHRVGSDNWSDSLSSRLVDATDGDVLLVKPPAPAFAASQARFSGREQRAHLAEQFV